jgi:hypothetical protein
MRRLHTSILLLALLLPALAYSQVENGSFTATWTPDVDRTVLYEFRWKHFAAPDWMPLPDVPGFAGLFALTFEPLPKVPKTDRWFCLDGRVKEAGAKWLSETAGGPACNTVDVGEIPLPPPPPPPEPPPTPDLNVQVGLLRDRLETVSQALAATQAQLAQMKAAACAMGKAGPKTFAGKMQAAFGGCP